MLDNRGVLFLVATHEEILGVKNTEQVSELLFRYEISADIVYFSAFVALYNLLFSKNEISLLSKVETATLEIFLCNELFVNKIAQLTDSETDILAQKWTDIYWKQASLGIWSQLYSLRFVCRKALEESKNIYVLQE